MFPLLPANDGFGIHAQFPGACLDPSASIPGAFGAATARSEPALRPIKRQRRARRTAKCPPNRKSQQKPRAEARRTLSFGNPGTSLKGNSPSSATSAPPRETQKDHFSIFPGESHRVTGLAEARTTNAAVHVRSPAFRQLVLEQPPRERGGIWQPSSPQSPPRPLGGYLGWEVERDTSPPP